jgi:hypothetical protein
LPDGLAIVNARYHSSWATILKATGAILALLIGATAALPAQAKLGQDFTEYKKRISTAFIATGQQGNNYMFTMNIDPKQSMASPGYAGGLTVTVDNGKVTGQSLAIRPGMQPVIGPTIAAVHGFAFAYEAIGKDAPKDEKAGEAEFKAFSGAVAQAFMGQPQNLRYPGYPGLITVSRDAGGNLIVACKFATPPAASRPAAATPSASAAASSSSSQAPSPSTEVPAGAGIGKPTNLFSRSH